MPNSFRIRTKLSEDKNIQVKLDQDFDTLEVLSLTITPDEIYTRTCANFGVVCGRVFCNNGFGLPNARLSIFVPLQSEDENSAIITALYPYKSTSDTNEDGYKYNLLPYTASHSGHVPVGTFPDRLDTLIDKNVIEVYDKYYKYTVQTNDSGDFMLFGLPVGAHQLLMQVDLSDIGPFSQTPQDLIRMGRAQESQVDGSKFKFSVNYDELPQIVTIKKNIEVSPFFGQPEICNYNIFRVDFDLTAEVQVKLDPTAVFMGSIFSTNNSQKLGYRRFLDSFGQASCKSSIKMGNLCDLISGPGSIEAIRQTSFLDENLRPILEEYKLDNGGKVIDENGVWVAEVPMNLDYVYTDEYGVQRISNDPNIGIPTRGKYRFKVKWQQSPALSDEIKRGYYLVPNIKEYGWYTDEDPVKKNYLENTSDYTLNVGTNSLPLNISNVGVPNVYRIKNITNITSYSITNNGETYYGKNLRPSPYQYTINVEREDINKPVIITFEIIPYQKFLVEGSYAFSLDWSDYSNYQDAIDCKDTFYDMSYNKVYTVSSLIDRFQTSSFVWNTIQVKNILDTTCDGNYNKFPINDSHYKLSFLFLFISFAVTIFKYILFPLLAIVHVLAYFYDEILPIIDDIITTIRNVIRKICRGINKALDKLGLDSWMFDCPEPREINRPPNPFINIGVPLVLYTEDGCERCKCNLSTIPKTNPLVVNTYGQTSILVDSTSPEIYDGNFIAVSSSTYNYVNEIKDAGPIVLAGNNDIDIAQSTNTPWGYYFDPRFGDNSFVFSTQLPLSEMYNLFNTKDKYFDEFTNINFDQYSTPARISGWNQIKVKWQPDNNLPNDDTTKNHLDNVMILVLDRQSADFESGQIISFQDIAKSNDPNYLNTNLSQSGTNGTILATNGLTVRYADPSNSDGGVNLSTTYTITGFSSNQRQVGKFCADVEYFQVITGITVGEFYDKSYLKINHPQYAFGRRFLQRFPDYNIGTVERQVMEWSNTAGPSAPSWLVQYLGTANPSSAITNYDDYKIVILMRGVDIHSPRIDMKINLTRIFGNETYDWDDNNFVVRGNFKMNIPIRAGGNTNGSNAKSSTNHNMMSSNEGNSLSDSGWDRSTNSTIFYKSYIFEYKVNEYQTFLSQMPKYYSAVGPILHPDYAALYTTNSYNDPTITTRLNNFYTYNWQYRIAGEGQSYYSDATNYSITDKNLSINDSNIFRRKFNTRNAAPGYYDGDSNSNCVGFRGVNGWSLNYYNSSLPSLKTYLSNYQENEIVEGSAWYESTFNIITTNYYNNSDPCLTNVGFNVYKWNHNYTDIDDAKRGMSFYSIDYSPPSDPSNVSWDNYPYIFSDYRYIVIRTDRLPSSTNVTKFGANTMFLHQNPDFAIYTIDDNGETTYEFSVTQVGVSQNESNVLLPEYSGVLSSIQDCEKAVLQSCYDYDPVNGVPIIREDCPNKMIFDLDGVLITKFKYGTGCYNLVSKPMKSFSIDSQSITEWIARLKLNLAICFDVFSHSFTNQYINGALYAYAFSNTRLFNAQNQPYSEYCRDTVYLNDYSNTFYYRSSPYKTDSNTVNNGKFIGKRNPKGLDTDTGNKRLLGSPTTMLDLGPKVSFIQELVPNDDYDGYIVAKLKTTSYQNITQLMNMFILSRITSPSLSKLIVPTSDDPNEGDNDVSVQSFFQNTRWYNSPSAFQKLIPSLVDGDLSQMLSINSEFGMLQFTPENYQGDVVYFGRNAEDFPFFGILYSGNTQDRDYITPRRTIWNQNANFPPVNYDYDFTKIPVKTQVVPFYNWNITEFDNADPDTIFGSQSNDWFTEPFPSNSLQYSEQFQSFGYQSLDRLDSTARYLQMDSFGKAKYQQNYIINYNIDGTPIQTIPSNTNFSKYFIAGSPFHFYFGLKQGASALDVFIKRYVDENLIIE
jgi:hypothetical protein